MCGIAGAVWQSSTFRVEPEDFDRMTDSLRHRGPDGRGVYWKDFEDGSGVALGHRRLSIIDLSTGHQPMCNEDESIWIVFNGEIYNYQELRPSLESRGHRFRSHSDTETIVHLYEEYGDQFVDHLRGMFAIALFDLRRRRTVLVRDRLGEKPLVYSHMGDRLLFASEIKAIHCISGGNRTIRPQAIDEYLTYGYIPHPNTAYQDINKLPPAHMAVLEKGQFSVTKYWHPKLEPNLSASRQELELDLRSVVDEAVRIRLRSDVPLGAFLSGGIDSTVTVGLMQKHSSQPTNTFTMGFPEEAFDESPFAQEAADFLKTAHRQMQIEPDSIEILKKLVWHFDEPFADSSAIPTYYLSQLTRQHVTVALTGDGGDELFAGYPRYATVEKLSRFDRLPGFAKALATGPWTNWIPTTSQNTFASKLKNRLEILREPLEKRYVSWLTQFNTSARSALYNSDFRKRVDMQQTLEFLTSNFALFPDASAGTRAMRTDMVTYLPCDLLAKVDITSMAHGLECRSPFLDHLVVEAAARCPFSILCQPGRIKPMLTDAFSQFIPPSLRTRPKKGFSVPLDRWFKTSLADYTKSTLLSKDAFCHQYFSPTALASMLEEHASGKWLHGDRIWALLFLEIWGQGH